MKTAFKWFDFLLNVLLVAIFVSMVLFFYFGQNNYGENFSSTLDYQVKVNLFTFLLGVSFIFGVFYIFIGTILWIMNRKKNAEKAKIGKRIFFKGILKSVLAFFLYVLFSLALAFFGLSLDNGGCGGMCLPKIQDEEVTKGFPVQDLEIMHLRTWYNHNSDNAWSCDVTVSNNNPKLIAINLFFKNATEKDNDDQINPGGSKVISIYPDNNSQTPCENVSITNAQIIKYSSK